MPLHSQKLTPTLPRAHRPSSRGDLFFAASFFENILPHETNNNNVSFTDSSLYNSNTKDLKAMGHRALTDDG
jgi:hypothetical protein